MKVFILAMILFIGSQLCAQSINWKETTNWKLYDPHLRGFNNSKEKILAAKNIDLNADSIKGYLASISLYKPAINPVWMGNFILSFQTGDHQTKIIYVSKYGAFLYSSGEHIYFQLEEEDGQNLNAYLSHRAEILTSTL